MLFATKSFRLASFDVLPDNKRIVFCGRGDSADSAALYLLHRDTRKVERLTSGPNSDLYPAVTPDGKSVLFTSAASGADTPGSLYLQNFSDKDRKRLTSTVLFDGYAAFAPDMSRIVFARAARNRPYSFGGFVWDQWDLFTAKPDGTDVRQVTKEKYRSVGNPQWISGTSTLIFSARVLSQPKDALYIVDAQGSKAPRPLAQGSSYYCTNPSVSPKGDQIVFISDQTKAFDYEVWRMRPDGTKPAQVTRNGSYNTCPRFTPDGKHILFLSDPKRLDQFEMWQVAIDGSGLRRIADSRLFDDPVGGKP